LSQNSTILPVRDDETGELEYIDFSHGNAYDTLIRPFQTLINNVNEGIEDEEVLLKGFVEGVAEGLSELADPFISESIFTEALVDILPILGRDGRTADGKVLYTEQTPLGDKIDIIAKHLFKTIQPLSIPQFQRLGTAITGEPSQKTGEFYEIGDEVAGFAGFRSVKLNPLRSMGFKITNYQTGLREARREFTGGETGQLLKGGPRTANEVIRQFIIANRGSFNVQKQMHDDINAAKTLGINSRDLFLQFDKRNIGRRPTGMLFTGKFKPYFPSENIMRKFEEISREIGGPNPFKEALPTLRRIMKQLNRTRLDDEFYITPEDWIDEEPMFQLGGGDQSALPTPDVNPALMSQVMPSNNVMETGLTATEQALLSDEEKGIKLRNRGMTT